MAERRYLVDTSVLGRAHQPRVGDRLEELASSGLMWTCGLIDLEVVYGARARDVDEIIAERAVLPEAPINSAVMDRAVRVAGLLATAGHHRGAKPVDLVIAAAAEAAGLAVLHYDRDYERIAEVTRQTTEWVAPVGTLDN
ncbi:MAG: PIN domain-containing protein [Acidimicrobiia bacterium]|nr:PIN domain-containing protein [Acidimicrobiia bacterium]